MQIKKIKRKTPLRKDGEVVIPRYCFSEFAFERNYTAMKARNPMVIHYVHNMDRAITFYKNVFGVGTDMESPGWTTLDFGSLILALHSLPAGQDGPLPNAGLNFEVDQIEEVQANIEKYGGRLLQLREPGGNVPVRVGCFQDPEGNGFELRQWPKD